MHNSYLVGTDVLGADVIGEIEHVIGTTHLDEGTVFAAQSALKAAGFDLGTIDGKMGPHTEAAITAFWASRGTSHAAVVDDDLLAALNVTPGAPSPAPTSKSKSKKASGSSASSSAPPAPSTTSGFLQRMILESPPVKVWHALAAVVGAAIATGIGLAVRGRR